MNHSFNCGHEASEPRNMGRGAARAKRLLAYFNRRCISCAREMARFQATRLTDIRGNPLQGAALQAAIDAALERTRLAYK